MVTGPLRTRGDDTGPCGPGRGPLPSRSPQTAKSRTACPHTRARPPLERALLPAPPAAWPSGGPLSQLRPGTGGGPARRPRPPSRGLSCSCLSVVVSDQGVYQLCRRGSRGPPWWGLHPLPRDPG